MRMTFSVDGRTVSKKLGRIAATCRDFTVPFNAAADRLLETFSVDVFNNQGDANAHWRPLAASTLRARERGWGYYKQAGVAAMGTALIWTGKMRASFRKTVDRLSLQIDNTDPKFKYHQLGGSRNGRAAPPRRRMLYLSKQYITVVIDEIRDYVVIAMNQ